MHEENFTRRKKHYKESRKKGKTKATFETIFMKKKKLFSIPTHRRNYRKEKTICRGTNEKA